MKVTWSDVEMRALNNIALREAVNEFNVGEWGHSGPHARVDAQADRSRTQRLAENGQAPAALSRSEDQTASGDGLGGAVADPANSHATE